MAHILVYPDKYLVWRDSNEKNYWHLYACFMMIRQLYLTWIFLEDPSNDSPHLGHFHGLFVFRVTHVR